MAKNNNMVMNYNDIHNLQYYNREQILRIFFNEWKIISNRLERRSTFGL